MSTRVRTSGSGSRPHCSSSAASPICLAFGMRPEEGAFVNLDGDDELHRAVAVVNNDVGERSADIDADRWPGHDQPSACAGWRASAPSTAGCRTVCVAYFSSSFATTAIVPSGVFSSCAAPAA
mgnify:CR=1 FL=1